VHGNDHSEIAAAASSMREHEVEVAAMFVRDYLVIEEAYAGAAVYLRARLRGRPVRSGDGYHGGGARRVRTWRRRRWPAGAKTQNSTASNSKLDGGDLERSPARASGNERFVQHTYALVD
jgi:hypothetical protein